MTEPDDKPVTFAQLKQAFLATTDALQRAARAGDLASAISYRIRVEELLEMTTELKHTPEPGPVLAPAPRPPAQAY